MLFYTQISLLIGIITDSLYKKKKKKKVLQQELTSETPLSNLAHLTRSSSLVVT